MLAVDAGAPAAETGFPCRLLGEMVSSKLILMPPSLGTPATAS